jgi:hypothetical protein
MASHPEGYVYVANETRNAMNVARVGVRIALKDRRPPFIVVDSCIDQIIVARWPGRLWTVRIVDSVTEDDEQTTGLMRPASSAGYIRAVAVDVMHEIPAWKLFGRFGEAVCAVIAQASALDPDLVHALVQHRDSSAGRAYSQAWSHWLRGINGFPGTGNLIGTPGISGFGGGSPINSGFSLIYRAVRERAEAVVGDSAFVHDEDGESSLEPTWGAAADSLLEAAMAFAAPSVSDENGRRIMSTAWHTVIGRSPPNSLT